MLECSGNERAMRAGLDAMRPRGVVVQLGLGGDVQLPQNLVVAKELEIRGSFRFHAEFALGVRLINEGRHRHGADGHRAYPVSQAREAFELASDRSRLDEGAARLRRDGCRQRPDPGPCLRRSGGRLGRSLAASAPVRTPRRLAADDQHRHRRHPHDLLGVAADEQPADASAGRACRRRSGRPRRPSPARRRRRRRGPAAAPTGRSRPPCRRRGVLLHLLQDLLAHFPEQPEHVAGVGLAAGKDDAVEHVDQRMVPPALLRQADRFVEAADGRGAAVDRHEDALVHDRLS
jgi:hypothetical protein